MKNSTDIIWQSNTYSRMPVKADGFKYTGKGKLPRPTLTLSNLLGTITTILQTTNLITPLSDLSGAKVVRRKSNAVTLNAKVGSYCIKAVDKLGNSSANASIVSTNVSSLANFTNVFTLNE